MASTITTHGPAPTHIVRTRTEHADRGGAGIEGHRVGAIDAHPECQPEWARRHDPSSSGGLRETVYHSSYSDRINNLQYPLQQGGSAPLFGLEPYCR